MNWRGRPLTSHEVIVNTIAATRTGTGLRVRAELDSGSYPIGVRIDDATIAALPLDRHDWHDWHGDWNYTLRPEPSSPNTEPSHVPAAPRPDRAWLLQPAFTGMPTTAWRELIEKLALTRHPQREAALHDRRGGGRKAAAGTGRKAVLSLEDRALSSVLHQRFGTPQRTIAALFGVTRQTIHKTIGQTNPLPTLAGHNPRAARTRLRTLSYVLDYAAASAIDLPPEIQNIS